MKRRHFLGTGISAIAAPLILTSRKAAAQTKPASSATDDGWITLFNGRNLDGWYTYLPSTGKNEDPKKVFKVEQNMIHILDVPATSENQEFGYLASNDEYSDCRIRVEFKWGMKRYPPRLEARRDNGLLYLIVGPDRVWPTCIECQIQESDVGDLWLLGGAVATPGQGGRGPGQGGRGPGQGGAAAGAAPGGAPAGGGGRGAPQPQSGGRIFKDANFEDLTGWNVVEVILQGDRTTHVVNGRIVNAAHEMKQPDPQNPGKLIPLTRGRIALQAEGAEAWHRSVKVKPLA
jgi:hypothetical protein